MVNRVPESLIPWELLDHWNRATWMLWVSGCHNHYSTTALSATLKVAKETNVNGGLGVIPRAATALFEKLEGPRPSNRNSMSGLRTPTRYSANSAATMSKGGEKN